jgi:alanyl-tRNA synthetase
VVLDGTYFYPTSGGQPHDTGTLSGSRVTDVAVREPDGAVLHVVDRLPAADRVEGRIDWGRRVDHMQQHTGQHILSQAFIREIDAPTIGFHLGDEYVSIDLDGAPPTAEATQRAFDLANHTVASDVAVRAWFPTPEELATMALRKTPVVDGALRIVAIGDFDRSACGGTHVARTGEIGLIHHLRTERLKRGARVSFLAAGRARRDYAAKHAIVARLSAQLTCAVEELPEAVTRMQDDLQSTRREIGRYQDAALDREAEELLAAAGGASPAMVARAWDARPADELRQLVMRATARQGAVVLLGTAGGRGQFVFGRSEDTALDLKPALDAALAAIGGGRGGGGRIVQGGGGEATVAAIERALAAARAALGG